VQELIGKTLNRYQLVGLLVKGAWVSWFKGATFTCNAMSRSRLCTPTWARRHDFQERFSRKARSAPASTTWHRQGPRLGQGPRPPLHRHRIHPRRQPTPDARRLARQGPVDPVAEAVGSCTSLPGLHYAIRQASSTTQSSPTTSCSNQPGQDLYPYQAVITDLDLAS